jgi:hypothetical protein
MADAVIPAAATAATWEHAQQQQKQQQQQQHRNMFSSQQRQRNTLSDSSDMGTRSATQCRGTFSSRLCELHSASRGMHAQQANEGRAPNINDIGAHERMQYVRVPSATG